MLKQGVGQHRLLSLLVHLLAFLRSSFSMFSFLFSPLISFNLSFLVFLVLVLFSDLLFLHPPASFSLVLLTPHALPRPLLLLSSQVATGAPLHAAMTFYWTCRSTLRLLPKWICFGSWLRRLARKPSFEFRAFEVGALGLLPL